MASNTRVLSLHALQFTSSLAHFLACILIKNSFNVKYLENGDRYHDGVEYETDPGLSIG